MPDLLEHFVRIDSKLGQVDSALAAKIGPPTNVGTFDPTMIDLSLGQREYDAYDQTGAIAFALDPSKTPSIGGTVLVNIRGGGFPVTFPSNFVGLGSLFSGAVLQDGTHYPFAFRHGQDWEQVSPGVFEDRVLVQADGIDELAAALAYEPANF